MSFTPSQIQQVWEKGIIVPNHDPDVWRKDQCTAWIKREEYGNRSSMSGWEIDHIDGNANNNSVSNLRPLQWDNDRTHQKGPLVCPIISQGEQNIRRPH